jgi:hypothetical protein
MTSNISFDPNNPIYNPGNEIFQGATRLNITDTQIQLGGSKAASSPFQADRPDLTILGYRKTVSDATHENKKVIDEILLDESNQYKDLRFDKAISADELRARINAYSSFYEKFDKARSDGTDAVNDQNGAVGDFNDNAADLVDDVNQAANAVNQFNASSGDQDAIDDYNEAVDNWNEDVADYNGWVDDYNEKVDEYNAKVGDLQPKYDELEQLAALLPEDPPAPVLEEIQPIPHMSYIDPLPNAPPATPGTAPQPDFPIGAPAVIYNPNPITEEQFNNTYILPTENLLKTLGDANDRADKEIAFQNYYQLAFGQFNLEAGVNNAAPVNQDPTVNATGGALATAGDNKSNPNLPVQMNSQAIEDVYKSQNAYPSLVTQAKLEQLTDLIESRVVFNRTAPDASVIAGSGLVGPTPNTSPSVLTGTALHTLENLQAVFSDETIYKTVFNILAQDDATKNIEDITALVKGIEAAILLQVTQAVILQIEKAIGSSGLLAQVLANLGSVDKDTILQLTEGLIAFKNAFDSPVIGQAIIDLTSQSLQDQAQLSEAKADQIARDAFIAAAQQQAIDSDNAAKQAFLDSVRASLEKEELDSARTEASIQAVRTSLDDANSATLALQDEVRNRIEASELRKEVNDSNLDREDREELLSRLDEAKSREEKEALLNEAGLNANEFLTQAEAAANNPLRSFVQTEPLTREELGAAFNERVVASLNQPGAIPEESQAQADKFTDILVAGPNSVLSLVDQRLNDYNKAVQRDQSDNVSTLFNDGLTMNWSADDLARDKYNAANFLVYSDKPAYAGIHSTEMKGGSPAGTGYSTSDKIV